MSVSHTLAKNTLIQLVGKAVSTALGMVAVAIMTRSLGIEQFGWYVTAVGFLQFVGLLSDFGFTVTTTNLLAEPTFDKRSVLNVCFSWRFVSALVFQLAAPLLFLFFPYNAEIKMAVAITTVSFFALALTQIFIALFREGMAIHVPVAAELAGRVVLVLGVGLAAINRTGFLSVMALVTLASVVSTLYLWWHARPVTFNFDRIISAALWQKIAPTALTVVFNAVYLQGDRVLLPLFVDQTTVAYYGASYRVLDIIIQMAALVMGLVMPLITYAYSRGLTEEFSKRLTLGTTTLALVIAPMATGIICLATPIIRFVAGSDFAPAGAFLAPLTLSMFGVVFGMAFGHVLLSVNRQKESVWVYASCAVLSLAGYGIFIPRFGAWGGVGVTIFSEWYTGLCLLYLTKRYTGQLPAFKPLALIACASIIMALVVFPLRSLPLYVSVPAGALVYIVVLAALKVINPSDWRAVMAS